LCSEPFTERYTGAGHVDVIFIAVHLARMITKNDWWDQLHTSAILKLDCASLKEEFLVKSLSIQISTLLQFEFVLYFK